MSYRERMQVQVSRAEEEIFKELQRRHLCDGLNTQHGIEFDVEKDGVAGTIIDFFWSPWYAAFIDGVKVTKKGFLKLHLRPRQEVRDELITIALERRTYIVDRFQYEPPLRNPRRDEICDKIETRLHPKICHLVLMYCYYDLIDNKLKKVERRRFSDHNDKRIRPATHVTFHRGYTKTTMTFEIVKKVMSTTWEINLGRRLQCIYGGVCVRFPNCPRLFGDHTKDYSCWQPKGPEEIPRIIVKKGDVIEPGIYFGGVDTSE